MSRIRTYGTEIAVQTSGPFAVEPEFVDQRIEKAGDLLARYFSELMKRLSAIGVELDPDTYEPYARQGEEEYVIGFTIQGRQKRNLIARLRWAAGL